METGGNWNNERQKSWRDNTGFKYQYDPLTYKRYYQNNLQAIRDKKKIDQYIKRRNDPLFGIWRDIHGAKTNDDIKRLIEKLSNAINGFNH